MARSPISVTIITRNEEHNLPRAIHSVKAWAEEIVVVDSGSTDRTVEIARAAGARVIIHPWPGYGQQKNFAHAQASHPWILNIDADEEIPASLAEEIQRSVSLAESGKLDARGFAIPRKTFYLGRWIMHGGWYPNYLVRLSRKDSSRWTEPEVHEALQVDGPVLTLKHPMHHYTFTCIEDQVLTNLRYSRRGHEDLKKKGRSPSLLMLLFKPIGKFIETYVIKRGFMDGLPGLIISINAAHSIFLKYAYFYEESAHR